MFRTLIVCINCLPGHNSQKTEGTIEPRHGVCHPQAGRAGSSCHLDKHCCGLYLTVRLFNLLVIYVAMRTGGLSKGRLDRMHEVMARYVERGEVPGIVTLVCRRDEVHADAIGVKAVGGRLVGEGPEIAAHIGRNGGSPGTLGQQDADHAFARVRAPARAQPAGPAEPSDRPSIDD